MRWVITVASIVLGVASVWAADDVTFGTLVDEMVDMHHLTRFPTPAYKTVQFSSYDRRSKVPNGPDWFQNADGFGNEPIPNVEAVLTPPGADGVGEYLLCDVKGPGALARCWTAAINGTLRLYIDNTRTPVYDGSAQDFLLFPFASFAREAGIDIEPLKKVFTQANASYFPIPFARRFRIEWTGKISELHFYHIELRRYEKGARVKSFSPEDLQQWRANLDRTVGIMGDPDKAWRYRSTEPPVALARTVGANGVSDEFSLTGPAAIEKLTLRLDAANRDLALRQTVMHIHFDDSHMAQVQAPVGDFFGAAPGVNPYASVPFTVSPDGSMTCRFVMPFERSAKIFFENLGLQEVTVAGQVVTVPYAWDDRSMHFRARWRAHHDMVGPHSTISDIPYLVANGTGVYVGSATYIMNPCNIPSMGGSWWGEGDEKIFFDDAAFPAFFGTGSEDYYNYAWSANGLYLHPYWAQPRVDGPANRGFTTNNRWHILDALPFHENFRFYMEFMPHSPTPGTAYHCIGYLYGRPGMTDDHRLITREDVRAQSLPESWTPLAAGGCTNAVFFELEAVTGTSSRVVREKAPIWSEGQLFRCRPEGPGDKIVFELPVSEAGTYRIAVVTALDPSSGTVVLQAGDGEPRTAQLYRPHRTMARVTELGEYSLGAGKVPLTVTYEKAGEIEAANTVGVDFFILQRR